jgi:hypothetical protein
MHYPTDVPRDALSLLLRLSANQSTYNGYKDNMARKLSWSKIIAQGGVGAVCGLLVPWCLWAILSKILQVFGMPKDFAAFAIVSITCASSLTFAVICVRQEMRAQVKEQRRNTGLCTQCGYDLRGSTSDRCPECGSVKLGKFNGLGEHQ